MRIIGPVGHLDSLAGRIFQVFSTSKSVHLTELFIWFSRSIDMDKCPERLACEIGLTYFKNSTNTEGRGRDGESGENGLLRSVLKYVPKGQIRTVVRTAGEALRYGSKHGNCFPYNCQPRLRSAPVKSNAGVKTAKEVRKEKNRAAEDGIVTIKESATSQTSKSNNNDKNNGGTKQNNSKTEDLVAEP